MNEQVPDCGSPYLDAEGTGRQITVVTKWLASRETGGSYDRLCEMKVPVFVANGDNDVLVSMENSWVLLKKTSNTHLGIRRNTLHCLGST